MAKQLPASKYGAILAVDPAQGCTGMALRLTGPFAAVPPERGRLASPNWTYAGPVVAESGWADDLAMFMHDKAPGAKLGLVVEHSTFGGMNVARSIGQAIGSVRFALHALNLLDGDPLKVTPAEWRKWAMPAAAPSGSAESRRREWKENARAAVVALYGFRDESKDADIAEAILMLDWACITQRKWWRG